MSDAKDVLGNPMTEAEQDLMGAYERLLSLLSREDLPPSAESNVKEAIACLWQAVNDLALVDDRPAI